MQTGIKNRPTATLSGGDGDGGRRTGPYGVRLCYGKARSRVYAASPLFRRSASVRWFEP